MAKRKKTSPTEAEVVVDQPLDPLDIPPFLFRKKTGLPPELDLDVVDDIEAFDKPLELAADGMNIISMYMNEGGHRRFLVVKQGRENAHLLYLPELEHYEIPVREMHEQITSGRAHWFAVPPNTAARLKAKAAKWDEFNFRYSRALVNEALANLGASPLPAPLEPEPGTEAAKKKASRPNRGPGVIGTLIELLQNGGGTIDELLAALIERFPERGDTMKGTIRTQLTRLPKQGTLDVIKVGDRYVVNGSPAADEAAKIAPVIKAKTKTTSAIPARTLPAPKGDGVIGSIISILENGGGTVDEILAALLIKFPGRDESMKGTIRTQLNRLPRSGRLQIVKDANGRYAAASASPSPPPSPSPESPPAKPSRAARGANPKGKGDRPSSKGNRSKSKKKGP